MDFNATKYSPFNLSLAEYLYVTLQNGQNLHYIFGSLDNTFIEIIIIGLLRNDMVPQTGFVVCFFVNNVQTAFNQEGRILSRRSCGIFVKINLKCLSVTSPSWIELIWCFSKNLIFGSTHKDWFQTSIRALGIISRFVDDWFSE